MRLRYVNKYRILAGIFVLFLLYKYLTVNRRKEAEQAYYFEDIDQKVLKSNEIYDKYQIYSSDSLNKNYYYYKYKTSSSVDGEIKLEEKNNKRERDVNKEFYVIFEYTKVFNQPKYCNLKIKNDQFSSEKLLFKKLMDSADEAASRTNQKATYDILDDCLYKNCFFTCDKIFAKQANALLFHETDLKNELQVKNNLKNIMPFNDRTSSQIWILWNDEANGVQSNFDRFNFNWTISYKSSSEVSFGAYGVSKYKDKPVQAEHLDKELKAEFRKRSNKIVWFNSNCASKLRIEYARNLSRYYPLHVRGKCNQELEAVSNDYKLLTIDNISCSRDSLCELNFLKLNKYYLAFESKNCTDYITEKFWRSLSLGILPIVFQPSKVYYERLAPADSFIHLEDFEYDMEKLSKHLKEIDSNFSLFKKYFEWKAKFDIIYDMKLEKIRMCELCAKLNREKNEIYYKSVSKFFNNKCIAN